MLEQFTHDTFVALVGMPFRIFLDEGALEVELIEALPLRPRPAVC